jgi:hypothetical protein
MRNISNRILETLKTHVLSSVTFFRISCLLWDNVEKCCKACKTTDMILWIRFTCWIPTATNINTNTLFESATILGYKFIASLVLRIYLNRNAVTLKTERYTRRRLSVAVFPYSSYAGHNYMPANSTQAPSWNRATRFLGIGIILK